MILTPASLHDARCCSLAFVPLSLATLLRVVTYALSPQQWG